MTLNSVQVYNLWNKDLMSVQNLAVYARILLRFQNFILCYETELKFVVLLS